MGLNLFTRFLQIPKIYTTFLLINIAQKEGLYIYIYMWKEAFKLKSCNTSSRDSERSKLEGDKRHHHIGDVKYESYTHINKENFQIYLHRSADRQRYCHSSGWCVSLLFGYLTN